ncbi:MAG: anthranilate synthase component I family protein [Ferruginibacter sp.]|nr:anthranilate synthase component I family protein [Ferruginibacter sp.]
MNKDEQNFIDLKMKMLNWANQFNIFCLLDNNGYNFEAPAFECLLAVGCIRSYSFSGVDDFAALQKFYDANPSWLFGHLGYNAASNSYEKYIHSDIDFGKGFFFEPETILKIAGNNISVIKSKIPASVILEEIKNFAVAIAEENHSLNITPTFSKEAYLDKIAILQQHIKRGDCYEINFCQQFIAENAFIDVATTYKKLAAVSPAPFGSFYKLHNYYCLCASPERFLQKKGNQLISQPIKGTSRREVDTVKDEANKKYLIESTKEKSENVMVVDLVRNDMSMVCEKGSVKVKELFGIYSFPQVHQMISTIQGTLAANKTFTNAIEACFPMGSMTGAPKKRVMELIERYETSPRGLFSGSIGYITPNADFDFNVVIRSIFYNKAKKKLSFFAGSGITFYSKAEEEYEECMMKAIAIIDILSNKI